MITLIFISYRRADSKYTARKIHDWLESEFGDENVFMDERDIPPGPDFRRVLGAEIEAADVMLVVIGKNWLNITDDAGNKRLWDEDDYVRFEVQTALEQRHKLVVPLLVDRATMPKHEELPDVLQDLAYRNAKTIYDEPGHFELDMNTLAEELRKRPMFQAFRCIQELKALPEDAPWADIDDLLLKAEQRGGQRPEMVALVRRLREEYLHQRRGQVEALIEQAHTLLRARRVDEDAYNALVERALAIAPAPHELNESPRTLKKRLDLELKRRQRMQTATWAGAVTVGVLALVVLLAALLPTLGAFANNTPLPATTAAPILDPATAIPREASTPEPTPDATQAVISATSTPANAPLVLYYDSRGAVLHNASTSPVNVRGLYFQVGEVIAFRTDAWIGGDFGGALRAGRCLQVADNMRVRPALPRVCMALVQWRQPAQRAAWFWAADDGFRVMRDETPLTTCAPVADDATAYEGVCTIVP